MALIVLPSTSSGRLVSSIDQYSTPDSAPVGALVYFSGTNEARTADNGSISTAPADGIVLAKSAPGVATVLYEGEASGFSGLVPGQDVFLGISGGLVQAAGLPTSPGTIIQKVGRAIGAGTIFFHPHLPVVL